MYALAAISAACIVIDGTFGGLDPAHPALGIELAARVLMVVLAVFAASKVWNRTETRLLVWAVVLISLDAYWQTTYRQFGGRPLEWTEMGLKYAGTGLGLGALLRLCASFGDAPYSRLRAFLHRSALPFGGALTVLGWWHGVLYIQNCYYRYPGTDRCIIGDTAQFALDAYLVCDALLRLGIVAAAVVGYRRSSLDDKQRTALVAYFSIWFALGTAADFLLRIPMPPYGVVLLETADAVTTVLFPLGLLYAATRRRLFDVEYVVKLTTSYSLTTLIVGAIIAGIEVFLHTRAMHFAVEALAKVGIDEHAAEYFAGVPFVLMWKPLERKIERGFDRAMPERAERMERLRALIRKLPYIESLVELEEELRKGLSEAISARFADIFIHDGRAGFRAYISNRDPEPAFLRETEPPIPEVSVGKYVCLMCKHQTIPNAELAMSMPVGGKSYGILVCGPPRHNIVHFAHDEIEHLKEFAATAAGALFALRAGVRHAARAKGPGAKPPVSKRAPRKKSGAADVPPQEIA